MPTSTTDKTGEAFLAFIDYAAEKGMLKKNTAAGYRAACQRVLQVESGWERVDVSALDVDSILERFVNLKAHEYTPKSLETYKSRFRNALDAYLRWVKDPAAWKASTAARGKRADRQTSRTARDNVASVEASEPTSGLRSARDGMITYPFPLRENVDVELVLPRDLTPDEARRLVAFVNALAIEVPKGSEG